jgi:hypothetical protein
MLTIAAIGLALGVVFGFWAGAHLATRRVTRRAADIRVADVESAYARGHRDGGDELSDAMTEAALSRPDVIEMAWPRAGVVRWTQ